MVAVEHSSRLSAHLDGHEAPSAGNVAFESGVLLVSQRVKEIALWAHAPAFGAGSEGPPRETLTGRSVGRKAAHPSGRDP